jgi:hypothetical protein
LQVPFYSYLAALLENQSAAAAIQFKLKEPPIDLLFCRQIPLLIFRVQVIEARVAD